MENTEIQLPYLVSPKIFHLEMPLYHVIDITSEDTNKKIHSLMHYCGTIDAYCIYCEKESVFDCEEYYDRDYDYWLAFGNGFRRIVYACTRNSNHKYYTYHLKTVNSMQKIGQFPSVASFQIPQAEKYRKILGENRYKEFTKGIGLKAHGIGIGSFIYLRRIFESLIDEALEKYKAEAKKNAQEFSDTEYKKLRMDDKINFLKNFLPEFLVENRSIYSILSKGLHQLSEEECLEYFDAIKIGIEQILDEKILHEEKAQKARIAREGIQGVSKKINAIKG